MHEVSSNLECFFKKKTPWGSQKYLMALNTSGDVLVKLVEKLWGQHSHTGRGPGPTLNILYRLWVYFHDKAPSKGSCQRPPPGDQIDLNDRRAEPRQYCRAPPAKGLRKYDGVRTV